MISGKLNPDKIQKLETTGLLKCAKYYHFISDIMNRIHSKIPEQEFDVSRVARPTDIREEYFNGVNYKRAVMFLQSNGCEWALKSANGCTMCGHLARQTRDEKTISCEDYINQFTSEFNKINFEKYPLFNLYNNGSFFNDNEIPSDARKVMLEKVSKNPYIKMLVLETRPEFVTQEKMDEVADILKGKHVEIAIGLEAVDDSVRYACLNKGFSLKCYDEAAKIITKKLHLRTYVMLKPPFLSERESISQAVRTVKHAFKAGSTTVSLEACTIQDYTLIQYLSDREIYKTAWLWSIIEVVKRSQGLGKFIVGMFQFFPSPSRVPYNCDRCSNKVMEALKEYNRTLDKNVFEKLTCECKDEWKREVEKKDIPFKERLDDIEKELELLG